MEYIYLGDRHTDPVLKRTPCAAIRRPDGKCIRGKNGAMIVSFADGRKSVIVGRLLRRRKD
jgi:hypothetical protein